MEFLRGGVYDGKRSNIEVGDGLQVKAFVSFASIVVTT
jgi:hypothetical protein